MGLDSFKTEGPRTYTKDSDKSNKNAVHKLKGTHPDEDVVPELYHVHTVVRSEIVTPHRDTDESIIYYCQTCNRASTAFSSIAKVDHLGIEEDWHKQFMEESIELAEEVPVEDTLDDATTEAYDDSEQEPEDDSEDDSGGSGLMAFKT